MKLLCLHGYGTNGEVLRAQLQPILSALGGDQELVLLEGEVPVGASAFTGGFAPPYLAYYDAPNHDDVERAHKLIEEAIEIDGPFDGILGFSQGAGLAMSYLLHHRIVSPNAPSAFKFGIFFSTSSLQSPDPEYKRTEIMSVLSALGDEGSKAFHKLFMDPTTMQKDFANAPFVQKLDPSQLELLTELGWLLCLAWRTRDGLRITDKVEILEQLQSNTASHEMFPRFYHPVYTAERLTIPTVHCWGRNDSDALKGSAIMGFKLCSGGSAVSVQHGGRHEVPTRQDDAVVVANEIGKAFYLGLQQHVAAV